MFMKYYLIEGMTRIVATSAPREEFNTESKWLTYLQQRDGKLLVHVDLEQKLSSLDYADGDEVAEHLFIPAAVLPAMEDQFTSN
jgi:hypothetical protein